MQDSGLTHLMAGTTFAEHKDIARALRRAITATADDDLMVVQWEPVPTPTTTTTATSDDEEEVEVVVLAQWRAGWRSLRPEAMRLARAVEKRRLADADIAALGQIVAAPAADWSAVLAEMASRIGEDAAKAMARVAAAAARAASGPAPMEL
ncbi:hypothetical protein HDU88_006717 [Geranomyces variabilis]|nr:hypothetical protein HDU88_006717 [Geranomyces variabilis]